MVLHQPDYERILRRSFLPQVLFSPDICCALGIPEHEAEVALREGLYGAHFEVGDRPAVLRDDFLGALERRGLQPGGPT